MSNKKLMHSFASIYYNLCSLILIQFLFINNCFLHIHHSLIFQGCVLFFQKMNMVGLIFLVSKNNHKWSKPKVNNVPIIKVTYTYRSFIIFLIHRISYISPNPSIYCILLNRNKYTNDTNSFAPQE